MHFKNNRSGFTLAEALIAVLVVAIALTPIVARQSGLMRRVSDASRLFDNWLKARQFFAEARESDEHGKSDWQLEKKVGTPPLHVQYNKQKISGQSSLKAYKNLYRHQVTCKNTPAEQPQTMLVTFILEPEKKTS